jgi:hypothetical protein
MLVCRIASAITKLNSFFSSMMEGPPSLLGELPPDILAEILSHLTPIQISRLGVVSKWMLEMLLKRFGVKTLLEYVEKWRCEVCTLITPKLYTDKKILGCRHQVERSCIRCMNVELTYCGKCRGTVNAMCTRCGYFDLKVSRRECPHGWEKIICGDRPCMALCKKCFKVEDVIVSNDGDLSCENCENMEWDSFPECLCDKVE